MDTSQYFCEEWWLGDSTCCISCTSFLASAAATLDLQCSILLQFQLSVDKVSTARTLLRSLIDTPRHWDRLNRLKELGMRPCCKGLRSVEEAAASPLDRARLLAATAAHGSEWIFALPITAGGLRLSNEAIRVAIGLRLDSPCANLTLVHAAVNARGLHELSCKRSAGRSTRHQQLNDVIWRVLRRADIQQSRNHQD